MTDKSKDKKGAEGLGDLSKMLDPKNMARFLPMFVSSGSKDFVEQQLPNINMLTDGPGLLATAIANGQPEIADLFIQRNVSLSNPALSVPMNMAQQDWCDQYRPSPYVMLAASSGSVPTMRLLQENSQDVMQTGFFGVSKRRKNALEGNPLHAAAYTGSARMIKHLCQQPGVLKAYLNAPVSEMSSNKGAGALQQEMTGYTPLMLACVAEKATLDAVKTLLAQNADFKKREPRDGNTVLHLAAKHAPHDILEYLVMNIPNEMLFERNTKGDTALTICQASNNTKAVLLLEDVQSHYDNSDQIAQMLLNDEQDQALKAEQAALKKK